MICIPFFFAFLWIAAAEIANQYSMVPDIHQEDDGLVFKKESTLPQIYGPCPGGNRGYCDQGECIYFQELEIKACICPLGIVGERCNEIDSTFPDDK